MDTQAAYTGQMGHVIGLRLNGSLPERLVLHRQSHSTGTDGWLSHSPLQAVQVDMASSPPSPTPGKSGLVLKKA